MEKKKVVIILILLGIVSICFIAIHSRKDIWDINAEKLKISFNQLSGDAVIDDITEFIPFDWDELYSFAPYTPRKVIYETIGYKWDNVSESVNEGMNQIVFVKDGEVVCYLYGYPENVKLGFDFGSYEGFYIKLSSKQKLIFDMKMGEDGIRYFTYIPK